MEKISLLILVNTRTNIFLLRRGIRKLYLSQAAPGFIGSHFGEMIKRRFVTVDLMTAGSEDMKAADTWESLITTKALFLS